MASNSDPDGIGTCGCAIGFLLSGVKSPREGIDDDIKR